MWVTFKGHSYTTFKAWVTLPNVSNDTFSQLLAQVSDRSGTRGGHIRPAENDDLRRSRKQNGEEGLALGWGLTCFHPPWGFYSSLAFACVDCCVSGRTQVSTRYRLWRNAERIQTRFHYIRHRSVLDDNVKSKNHIETKFNSDLGHILGNKYDTSCYTLYFIK